MLSLKEILILIFVLFGCLVIALANYKQPVSENPQQAETSKAILSETPYQVKALIWGETNDLEEKSDKQTQDDEKNQHVSGNLELVQGNPQPAEESGGQIRSPEFSQDNISPEITLSLETILAKVKNLSSDLWLEFQTIRQEDCPSCSQPEDNYYLVMGYSSWEEYLSSEQYRSDKESRLANQNSFSEENPSLKDSSPSICATILAVAGGPGCSCAPPCCTPYGCPCASPCCCVCCLVCCF